MTGAASRPRALHVAVPLSRATPPPFILPWFIDSVLAHVILVGLPLAFLARWSANRP